MLKRSHALFRVGRDKVVTTSVVQACQKRLKSLLLAWLLLLCLSLTRVSFAQGIDFSLQPDADITTSANASYFVYDDLKAGTVVEDAIRISNRGERTLHLNLFASDAATASNGGITFPTESGAQAAKTGRWLSLSLSELTLKAGETRSVPFQLLIPDEASGEYAAGIVVQEAAEGHQQETLAEAVGTTLVERAALTVLARVEGASPQAMLPQLEVVSLTGEFGGIEQVIMAELHNSGNLGSNAQGELTIYNPDGRLLHTLPIRLGYILAGDSLTYQLALSSKLESAQYQVKLALEYEGGSANHRVEIALNQAQKANVPVIEAPKVEVEPGVLENSTLLDSFLLEIEMRALVWLIFIASGTSILLSLRSLDIEVITRLKNTLGYVEQELLEI